MCGCLRVIVGDEFVVVVCVLLFVVVDGDVCCRSCRLWHCWRVVVGCGRVVVLVDCNIVFVFVVDDACVVVLFVCVVFVLCVVVGGDRVVVRVVRVRCCL